MRRKPGFISHKTGDKYYITAVGETSKEYNCLITCNESAFFIWEQLEHDCTREQLEHLFRERYELDEATAYEAVEKILGIMRENELVEE